MRRLTHNSEEMVVDILCRNPAVLLKETTEIINPFRYLGCELSLISVSRPGFQAIVFFAHLFSMLSGSVFMYA